MRVAVSAASAFAFAALFGAGPSQARCLAADVVVHWSGQPDQVLLTDGQCLVPTPFDAAFRLDEDRATPTPTGTPSGVYVDLWVPTP